MHASLSSNIWVLFVVFLVDDRLSAVCPQTKTNSKVTLDRNHLSLVYKQSCFPSEVGSILAVKGQFSLARIRVWIRLRLERDCNAIVVE